MVIIEIHSLSLINKSLLIARFRNVFNACLIISNGFSQLNKKPPLSTIRVEEGILIVAGMDFTSNRESRSSWE